MADSDYGRPYRRKKAALLADNPVCVWCAAEGKTTPADSADHWPPLRAFPEGEWQGELLPSCRACNFGKKAERAHRGKIAKPQIDDDDKAESVRVSELAAEWEDLLELYRQQLAKAVEEGDKISQRKLNDLIKWYRWLRGDERHRWVDDATMPKQTKQAKKQVSELVGLLRSRRQT